jgi:hypothetical protein
MIGSGIIYPVVNTVITKIVYPYSYAKNWINVLRRKKLAPPSPRAPQAANDPGAEEKFTDCSFFQTHLQLDMEFPHPHIVVQTLNPQNSGPVVYRINELQYVNLKRKSREIFELWFFQLASSSRPRIHTVKYFDNR